MMVKDLKRALDRYDDDQWVYICLSTNKFPDGCQISIQGVKETPPWNQNEKSKDLIGLIAHEQNTVIV